MDKGDVGDKGDLGLWEGDLGEICKLNVNLVGVFVLKGRLVIIFFWKSGVEGVCGVFFCLFGEDVLFGDR